MALPLHNYLRMYRKRAGFSQAEIAFLLGTKSAAKVSRYEHGRRQPSLRTLLACEVVLGAPARELFAGEFRSIENMTKRRAILLVKKLSAQKPDTRTQRKIRLLQAIAQLKQAK